jgi:hypothetical protein
VVALGLRYHRQDIERVGDPLPVAYLSGQRQSSLHQLLRTRVIALAQPSRCQVIKHGSGTPPFPYLEEEIHSLLEKDDPSLVLLLVDCYKAGTT